MDISQPNKLNMLMSPPERQARVDNRIRIDQLIMDSGNHRVLSNVKSTPILNDHAIIESQKQ